MPFPLLLFLSAFAPSSHASGLDGTWSLAGPRACSSDAPYEDPFFGRFVKSLRWRILGERLVEELSAFDPGKNFSCSATLEYRLTPLPPEGGRLDFLPRFRAERLRLESSCLRPGARPERFELHALAYPDFLEIYEAFPADASPCPAGEAVIMQFRRAEDY